MSVINSQPLIGASGNQGAAYNLTRSLRFRSSASAWLSRTPASTTNQQKYTLSTWVKRGQLGAYQDILDSYVSTNNIELIRFFNDDTFELELFQGSFTYQLKTTQVFRDPSAWYHIVVAYDTTQATASNRIKVYVNGVQVTSFSISTYPSQNANLFINRNVAHSIGVNLNNGNNSYFDGYLAEFNFIDGQQLEPSSFGETDTATGVWKPKKYTGTYGTNGYYLKFDNLTSTSTLGNDSSGNGNNWTVNNISLTSGATYDSMKDVPTLTDADTANYCVLNPLDRSGFYSGTPTISNGNLNFAVTGSSSVRARPTIIPTSGKWYFEVTQTTVGSTIQWCGWYGFAAYRADGKGIFDGNNWVSYGATYTSGDVIGVALDFDGGTATFYKNGVSQGSQSSNTSGISEAQLCAFDATSSNAFNFGQRPFAYTPPSGFKALNTFNLPTPTIGATASTQANKYFDATLYTGNGSSQSITNAGGFSPEMIWIKNRSNAFHHGIFDIIRGTGKALYTSLTDAETNESGVTAFNSNGFTVGSANGFNQNGTTLVAWQWDGGGAGSSNTAGTITSTVSANTSAGFSIARFTTPSSGTFTVGHGLGVAPSFIITKTTSNTGNWATYHVSEGATKYINLNSTSASVTASFWNNTAPTSTVFSGDSSQFGGSYVYVAYCFAEVAGYSRFGSYTGNGSTDGPFIYTGFRPKFYLYKRTDTTASWVILDAQRNTSNIVTNILAPNLANAESSFDMVDFCSNGIKIRNNFNADNGNGGTFIYAAFAENPFKYSLAR